MDDGIRPEKIESDYYLLGEDAFDNINELLELDVDEDSLEGYRATSCKAGIERFTNGKSNSLAAYKAASAASSKWEDPEFGAD